jgi:hypothetical protein
MNQKCLRAKLPGTTKSCWPSRENASRRAPRVRNSAAIGWRRVAGPVSHSGAKRRASIGEVRPLTDSRWFALNRTVERRR